MTVKTLEGKLGVTDAMRCAAAFAPKPSRGAWPQALVAPAALVAEGFSDGTLALKWVPQGRTRTTFVVETSADGQAWS